LAAIWSFDFEHPLFSAASGELYSRDSMIYITLWLAARNAIKGSKQVLWFDIAYNPAVCGVESYL